MSGWARREGEGIDGELEGGGEEGGQVPLGYDTFSRT